MDIIEFPKAQKDVIDTNMRRAIELAEESYKKGNRFNACVLVDPNQKNKVLQEAHDNTQRQIASVSHCVICLANSFGKYCKESTKQPVKIKTSRNESTFEDAQKEETKQIDSLNTKREAEVEDIDSYFIEEGSYYYCLGLDLYVVMEPCVMCSMALVHSTLNRVFYSIPYEGAGQGGVNEKIQLNNLTGLNHRYQVFYNVLSKEAQDLYKKLSV